MKNFWFMLLGKTRNALPQGPRIDFNGLQQPALFFCWHLDCSMSLDKHKGPLFTGVLLQECSVPLPLIVSLSAWIRRSTKWPWSHEVSIPTVCVSLKRKKGLGGGGRGFKRRPQTWLRLSGCAVGGQRGAEVDKDIKVVAYTLTAVFYDPECSALLNI